MCTVLRLNWYVLLCVMAASLTSTIGELTRTCFSDALDKRGSSYLCGQNLANMLSIICRSHGGYHRQARSAGTHTRNAEAQPATNPFMDKHIATSVLHSRGKRGIVCECCKHKCTFRELKEYCGRPQKRSFLALPPTSQDQVTSNSIDDITWGQDKPVQLERAEDDMDAQKADAPSSLNDLNSETDSQIGRLVRLLLKKPSVEDAKK